MIEGAIVTYILADSTITGYIKRRLYPVVAPQTCKRPYCVYHIITDPDDRVFIGGDASQPVFQFDFVANTLLECKNIKEAFRDRLSEYTGTLSGVSIIRIQPIGHREIPKVEDYWEYQSDYEVNYIRT